VKAVWRASAANGHRDGDGSTHNHPRREARHGAPTSRSASVRGSLPYPHGARNIRIEKDIIDQLFNSSEKPLARTLLLLARYGAA
jgi:hypothetical protein